MKRERTEAPDLDRPMAGEQDSALTPDDATGEPDGERHTAPVGGEVVPERAGGEPVAARDHGDDMDDEMDAGRGEPVGAGAVPDDARMDSTEPVGRTGDVNGARVGPRGDETVPNGAGIGSAGPVASTPAGSMAPGADEPAALLSTDDADRYLDEWRSVQASFVDDPSAATGRAEALVGQVIDDLTARIDERRTALSAQRTSTEGERTEQLRLALRGYRALLRELLPARP